MQTWAVDTYNRAKSLNFFKKPRSFLAEVALIQSPTRQRFASHLDVTGKIDDYNAVRKHASGRRDVSFGWCVIEA